MALGGDPAGLFVQAASAAGTEVPTYVVRFPHRAPSERSLHAFGWRERQTQHDLVYEHVARVG